ncbi:MAG: hypothetical protein EBU90_03290 [Proteobacteria bacterium]|nr:hypothetical protein [Pseudomonadota bacterium]NBP13351.1 hypothetical protein [bacterium]
MDAKFNKLSFNDYRELERILTEAVSEANPYGEKIDLFGGTMNMSYEAAKRVLLFIFKIFDPTGILSWPDFAKALERWHEEPNKWNFACLIAAIFCIVPTFAIDAAVAAATAATVVGAPAAPATALGTHLTVSILKGCAKLGAKFLKYLPKGAQIAAAIQKYGIAVLKQSSGAVISVLQKGIQQGHIPAKLLPALNKLFRRLQFPTRALQGIFNMGTDTAYKLAGAAGTAAGAGGGETPGETPESTPAAPGEEKIPYQLPDGRILWTTAAAVQSQGLNPPEQPQGEPVYNVGGQPMTQSQAQATGPYYTAVPPTYGRTRGEYIPRNVQQGATTNSFGRPFMSPAEYMRPDNFNNPPNLGPQSFYRSPNNYNPYGYNQGYGPAGALANIGNLLGGTLANMGVLAGQMAGTPVAGVANMAGGLLSILPGMGAPGMMPNPGMMSNMGMFPGLGI